MAHKDFKIRFEEYDPSTNTWRTMRPMPTARYDFAITVLNNKIYVMGGVPTNSPSTDIVEEFDPVVNSWRAVLLCQLIESVVERLRLMEKYI
jgi:N-acetylneuraminic acid mutarotase